MYVSTSTVESQVMPRKTAIRGKEKKVNKAKVLSVTTVKKQGHMSWECSEKSMVCKERMDRRPAGGRPMYKMGKVEGEEVADLLFDIGCSRTMVRQNWLP